MSGLLSIGAASRACGVKLPTIRYYEQIGLLSPLSRTDGNRRVYSDNDVRRLAFIRHARELGFKLDAIRTLLVLQDDPNQSCATADTIARARLAEVKHRIASLSALESELERMIAECSKGRVEKCRVIAVLADHSECAHEEHKAVVEEFGKAIS